MDLPTKYPEILKWAKGKKLFDIIAHNLHQTPAVLLNQLMEDFISNPQQNLISFLRIKRLEFLGLVS